MFSKNTVVTLALVPLAVLTLLPHFAYASPAAPDLQVRNEFPQAQRRGWDGLDMMEKRDKGGGIKEHGKDSKKSQRDYDLEKRGGKGGKKGKSANSKGKKNGRDYNVAARANGDGKGVEHKDGKDGNNHKSGTESRAKTKSGKD